MIRVFPEKTKWTPTDALAFVGDPPMENMRPKDQPVFVSATFTWHKTEAERLARSWRRFYSDVRLGGPAFGDKGGEFVRGRFIKPGVTITSRGCPKKCPFCFVPRREGKIRELPIKPGNIIQDNNLLACSKDHIKKVFKMLKFQKGISFNGGIDPTLFRSWHTELLNKISLKELWFSCDMPGDERHLEKVARLTEHISINKKRCFVLVGFDGNGPELTETRLQNILNMGFLPFAQYYQPETKRPLSAKWSKLVRKWSRPAAYRTSGSKTLSTTGEPG